MKKRARFLHGIYRKATELILQLRYDFQVWQETPLPEGPKIFCSNHFSSSDAHFVLTLMKDPLHMVIGPGFGTPIIKHYLRWTEQIPALTKEERSQVVERAVSYLQEGDSIYIFPEGKLNTVEKLDTFHAGLARMYLACPVPIIPIGLIAPKRRIRRKHSQVAGHEMTVVSKNYYANIGAPMSFEAELTLSATDATAAEHNIMDSVKTEVARLIDDIKTNKFWS